MKSPHLAKIKAAILARLARGHAPYSELKALAGTIIGAPTDSDAARDAVQDARDALLTAGEIEMVTYRTESGKRTVHRRKAAP